MSLSQIQGAFSSTNEAVYRYKNNQPILGTLADTTLRTNLDSHQHSVEVYGKSYSLKLSDEAKRLNQAMAQ
ncbi:MAG: hypothetical protein HQL58_00995 [Magnetococcales bacterium]|nr:hypothetical protein [Magnetococcales bacterium]